jgi:hypothetical protein
MLIFLIATNQAAQAALLLVGLGSGPTLGFDSFRPPRRPLGATLYRCSGILVVGVEIYISIHLYTV